MTKITRATFADANQILPLIQTYFSYTEINKEELVRRLRAKTFIFHRAMDEGEFCGYAEWEITDTRSAMIRLNGIAVTPDFQRRGIGHALLNEGENEARERDMKKMFLLVAENNIPAKKLYEKNEWNFARAHLKKINGEKTEVWEKKIV